MNREDKKTPKRVSFAFLAERGRLLRLRFVHCAHRIRDRRAHARLSLGFELPFPGVLIPPHPHIKAKNTQKGVFCFYGGEREIRTPGTR